MMSDDDTPIPPPDPKDWVPGDMMKGKSPRLTL
jgi:hypothetical protein